MLEKPVPAPLHLRFAFLNVNSDRPASVQAQNAQIGAVLQDSGSPLTPATPSAFPVDQPSILLGARDSCWRLGLVKVGAVLSPVGAERYRAGCLWRNDAARQILAGPALIDSR